MTFLGEEFETHCRIEKESLYPLVVKADDPSVSKRIGEADLEHRVIKAMLQEMSRSAPRQGWSDMMMKTLSLRFQRHGDELKIHLFPLLGMLGAPALATG